MKGLKTSLHILSKLSPMTNKRLSIAIPSFNRADILKSNILMMLPEIKQFSIQIFISDDSNNDETQNMINEIQVEYESIFYSRNAPSLGHDDNIFRTLSLPETDYVWLLGDSIVIKRGAIKNVLEVIDSDQPGIIAVNANNRAIDSINCHHEDCNRVFSTFAWHLTLTGATIYSKNAIASAESLIKSEFKNFPQIALIFNYLSTSCSFHWLNNKWICSNREKTSYWTNNMFKVFLEDWSNVVRSLPDCYDHPDKEKAIIDHSQKEYLFGSKSLLLARASGAYDMDIFRKYKQVLPNHSGLRLPVLLIIALIPKSIVGFLHKIKQCFK
jgi:glycosyltransferase involved in cell wall biosynthesis